MELSSGLALKALGGLAVASTVVTVGVVKKDSIASALGFKSEKLDESIITSLLPDCINVKNSTCKLTEEQLKKIKIISKDDETWESGITIEKDNATNEIVTVSWKKSTQKNADFSLGWIFTIKPTDPNKTIKIKKDSKEISITGTGVELWLKEKTESNQKKYYLAEELTYTKANNKLIEYINKDGQDIAFKVFKNESGTEDLTNSDLALESSSNPKTITIRVEVKTNNEDQFKVKSGQTKDPNIESLKQLNTGSADWDWECKIKLTTSDTISSKTELLDKNKLLKTGSEADGFFDVLKKDASNETGLSSTKKTKIKFIENCASAARSSNTARKFTSNKLSSEKTFQLKLGGTEANKLFFQDTNEFKKWFEIVS